MAFVREKISEDDIAAYRLRELNKRLRVIGFGNGWVIDRQRNIYFRWIRYDRENPSECTYNFYWKGTLLDFKLVGDTTRGEVAGSGSTIWSLVRVPLHLPPELEQHREEVLQDLRGALSVYGEFGMSSALDPHTAEFTF